MVITGPVVGTDRAAVISFLRAEGYAQTIQVADGIYAAWSASDVVGAVRLAPEHGVTVLRGNNSGGSCTARLIGVLSDACRNGARPRKSSGCNARCASVTKKTPR